jgi:hypothetical protein
MATIIDQASGRKETGRVKLGVGELLKKNGGPGAKFFCFFSRHSNEYEGACPGTRSKTVARAGG